MCQGGEELWGTPHTPMGPGSQREPSAKTHRSQQLVEVPMETASPVDTWGGQRPLEGLQPQASFPGNEEGGRVGGVCPQDPQRKHSFSLLLALASGGQMRAWLS